MVDDMRTTRKKIYEGVVVSRAGDKTIAVRVEGRRVHPLYKKAIPQSKQYLVHDDENRAKVGERVQFIATRPLSARKRWRLVKAKQA